ncbi:MAG: glycosyltransferase family 1 protein [Oscillospiraceae bacterium]
MIRVAQILGKMNGGGVEQVVMNYYRVIDREKVQFDFFLFKGSKYCPAEEIKALGGRLFVLPTFRHPMKYLKVLRRLLEENGYDIVHCHLNTLSFLPLMAAKQAGVKTRILHNHSTSGGAREWHRNLAKALLKPLAKKNATDYFACSEYAARWIYGSRAVVPLDEPELPGVKRVRLMPNAIDTERFSFSEKNRREMRRELKIPGSMQVFGHVGRFCPQKNQSFLIDIFREIHAQSRNTCLVMAGTGEDMELIKAKVIAAGLSDCVVFAGQLSSTDRFYSAVDCFLLPSNYEGLPVVGIEAQTAGLPCLFSDRVTGEAKITGSAQFLPLGNAADWACAALCCSGSRNKNAAEQITAKGYDIHGAAEKLCDFYLRKTEL